MPKFRWSEPLPQYLIWLVLPIMALLIVPDGKLRLIMASALAGGIAAIVAIAVHEAGHLVGGRLAGWRPALFIVGPLMLRWDRDGMRASLNRSSKPAALAASQIEPAPDLARRVAWMVAGGPLANLLTGALTIAALAAGWLAYAPDRAAVRALADSASGIALMLTALTLLAFAAMSLFLGVVNLLPLSSGGFYSDGARLLMLWRGGPKAERWTALIALQAAHTAGRRPREWDGSLVRQALLLEDESVDACGALMMAYYAAHDGGAHDEAERLLARAEQATTAVPMLRPSVACSAALFHALRGEAERGRAQLDRATGGFVMPHDRLLAEAAVLAAEGRAVDAAASLTQARAALDVAAPIFVGSRAVYEERFDRLESAIARADSPIAQPA